jgi:hypothetical protein
MSHSGNLETPQHTGSMDGNFYNTNHLTGDDLRNAWTQTGTQADKILNFLKEHSEGKFTSCEIRKHLIDKGVLSSATQENTIRARLTGLAKKDYIIKLPEMRNGFYGKPNHLWTAKKYTT